MGNIYGGLLFTIYAVSGKDADYGLPGVRPGTRSSKQINERVGNLMIANLLPWMEEPEPKGAWSSRAWTFQERALSQRALLVGDGVIFNCLHTYCPEDEHCCHALEKEPVRETTAKGATLFYAGLDKRSKACRDYDHRTNFDLYATLTSEYTERHLTFQMDAARAFQGILGWLEKSHHTQFIHGLPETEMDAALLWSPIGSYTRRCHADSAAFLFPSWSWLGWIGHATYSWTLEREYFMSTAHSSLVWRNANHSQPSPTWFTSEDLCLPRSEARESKLAAVRKEKEDHLGLRLAFDGVRENRNNYFASLFQHPTFRWPADQKPAMKYATKGSRRLCFHTLSEWFYVEDRVYQRKENYNIQHKIFRLPECDKEQIMAGYIDIPDPELSPAGKDPFLGLHEFVVLSRSMIGTYKPVPDLLKKGRRPMLYSQKETGSGRGSTLHSSSYINEKGNLIRGHMMKTGRGVCLML